MDVDFSEGFGFASYGWGDLGVEFRRVGEDSGGHGDFGVGAEEYNNCVQSIRTHLPKLSRAKREDRM